MALQFHPDKNSAPGADEVFKRVYLQTSYLPIVDRGFRLVVSDAFSCLSDPDKRRQYDLMGGGLDFNARPSAARSNGMQFEGEMSPEDLFNMFFQSGNGAISNWQTRSLFTNIVLHDRLLLWTPSNVAVWKTGTSV